MKCSKVISDKPRRARHTRRSGSVIVMVALSLATILGCAAIAVDYGVLVSDANQLQRACDAAAVAGAQKLYSSGLTQTAFTYDQYNARQLAISVAARNGITVDPNDVTFPASNKIRVQATRTRSLFFAQALGRSNGTVTRNATAGRLPLRGVTRAVPLAMTTDDYLRYRDGGSVEYQLINNHETDFVDGTVASLDLRPDSSGKSGAVFQEDLTYGYNGTVYLNQKIDNALNADINSQGAKLDRAMQDRIIAAAAAPYYDNGSNFTYPNYPANDPRIMIIVVALPNLAANNNPTLSAQYFVPVYIESVRTPANKKAYLRLKILPTLTYNSQDPMIELDSNSTSISTPGPTAISLLN